MVGGNGASSMITGPTVPAGGHYGRLVTASAAPTYTTLLVERHGPVGWLTFHRPGAANAIDATMFAELDRAWVELDADPAVRVIVNTGSGAAFQTGLDMVQLSRDPDALRTSARQTKRAELRLTAWHHRVAKPVIAAVNGVCAGGGLHFVADADIVIAADTATFLDPHVSVGQASVFETVALARTSPVESIMRMALVGRHERMDAQRAYQLGICSQVVPAADLAETAQRLAEVIAANDPAVVTAAKRALWAALEV